MESDAEITPEALKQGLDAGDGPAILNVREPSEAEIAALPGSRLIPMDDLPFRLDELDPARDTVVCCHHGLRSAAVVEWLRAQEIPAVNLRGGIDAWACAVDLTLRRY